MGITKPWPPEALDRLKKEWASGVLAKDIAARLSAAFDRKFTASAVIAMASVRGLPKRGTLRAQTIEQRKALTAPGAAEAMLPVRRPPPMPRMTGSIPGCAPKSLIDLRARECRYPLDDGKFCALETDGRTYCAGHHAACHRPHGSGYEDSFDVEAHNKRMYQMEIHAAENA